VDPCLWLPQWRARLATVLSVEASKSRQVEALIVAARSKIDVSEITSQLTGAVLSYCPCRFLSSCLSPIVEPWTSSMHLLTLEVFLCLHFLPQSPSLNIESRVFACGAAPTLAALLKSSDLWLSTEGVCDRCNCDTSNALPSEPSASHCVMPGRSCIRRTFCMARQMDTVWDVARGKATSVPWDLSSCRRCSICLLLSVAVVGLSSARRGG
jgi:hypothetical protein